MSDKADLSIHHETKPEPRSTSQDTAVSAASKYRLHIVTLCICIGGFLTQLDRTIVTTALPQITNDFQSFSDYGWYGSAYLLSTCALQPIFGRTYAHFDVKWTYVASMAVFEVGSIICGTAPGSVALIIGRAISGVGAAGMLTGSFVAVSEMIPLRKQPIHVAGVSTVFSLGTLLGPLLGGAFTSQSTWRWCFYINLPIGIPVLIGVALFFKPLAKAHTESRRLPLTGKLIALDFPGAIMFVSGCVMLILALHYAAGGNVWSSALIIGLLVGAGCTGILFLLWVLKNKDTALIPPRILFARIIAFSALCQFLLWSAIIIHTYFLPIHFQALRGKSAIASGVDMMPYIFPGMFASLVTGVFVTRTGYFTQPCQVGCAVATVGAGLLYTLQTTSSTGEWVGFEILTGAGIGLATQQGFVAIQACLPRKDIGIGMALINLATNLGGAVFVSAGNAILLDDLRSTNVPGVDVGLLIEEGATAFRHLAPVQDIPLIVQGYESALRKTLLMALILMAAGFCASIGMSGGRLPVKKEQSGQTRHEADM